MEPYVTTGADDPRLLSTDFVTNQYVLHDGKAYRFDGRVLVPTRWSSIKGFTPKNVEQQCLFDLLDNDRVPVKTVVGIAGSGKTKASLQYGLHKVLDGKRFERLLIVRQPAVVGEEIGFLKGSLADKLAPWQSAIIDNLEGGRQQFDELMFMRKLEFDIPSYMQGRDIKRTYVVVDEAQMLTVDQVKMLGSRVSEGSIIVFAGDVDQTFKREYKTNNGLTRMIEVLAGRPEFGFIRLHSSVRSSVAEMFASIM